MMKVAIVYDRVNKWGGAERVLLAFHEIFPEAPLYTSVYNPKTAPWASVFPKIYPSFLQKIPFAKNWHEGLAWLMPLAFESFNFDGYDLVISVTSEAAKGIITKPQTKHICYCLTPTRYLWSHYNTYFKGWSLKAIAKPVVNYLRTWDKIAAQRPDVMIAISSAVRERIKKYYQRDAEIIFPPVVWHHKELLFQERHKRAASQPVKVTAETDHPFLPDTNSDYYLVVSRLVPYKRVDLAIEAFNRLRLPLIIVGTGSQAQSLKLKAKGNIKFVGQVSDLELAKYYQGAKALIMPQEEDFGLVAVEAQAAGTPVIAFNRGGARDTVIDGLPAQSGLPAQAGQTGLFFNRQSPESLIAAVKKFDKIRFNPRELKSHAKKFAKENFKKRFLKLIKDL